MRRRPLLAGLLGLSACGLSERPYLERRQWPLIVQRPAILPSRRGGRVLLVRTIRAGPGLEVRGLQSMRADGSVRIDFYEEWAVPPAQAVEDALRQWLAASGLFAAVVAPGSQLAADWTLEGDMTAFWADLSAMRARARIAIVLLDQRPNPVRVLLQRTFTAEAPLAATDPGAIVVALKAALSEILAEIETAIGGIVSRRTV